MIRLRFITPIFQKYQYYNYIEIGTSESNFTFVVIVVMLNLVLNWRVFRKKFLKALLEQSFSIFEFEPIEDSPNPVL